ncbi:undecaprenyl diphosphate synthase family protein, partial [Enterobacter quasiroggenkampii]|nr:undecaprenyl diphosphate synthase family protein [Enterobacter quasiroggenkampii]
MRIPNHIGIIPDGNRRWAVDKGMTKERGYALGLDPGLMLFKLCKDAGVKEITYYGFTTDNTKRPANQREAFTEACINAVEMISKEDASLLVVGNTDSPMFPKKLLPYTKRQT